MLATIYGITLRTQGRVVRVAPGVDGAAVMPLDQRIHRRAILPQRADGAGLVAFHQPRIALDVRAQDRRQPPLDLGGHIPPRRGARLSRLANYFRHI